MSVKLPSASASLDGIVTNGTQTIAGAKTWNDVQTWLAAAGTVSAGSYTSAGAWTFGNSGTTAAHTVFGAFKVDYPNAGAVTSNGNVTGKAILSYGAGAGTIQGFSGGAPGQLLWIYGGNLTSTITFAHFGGGTQKFLCPGGAPYTPATGYGGITLICDGTFWILLR